MRRDALHPTDPWRYLAARLAVAATSLCAAVGLSVGALWFGPLDTIGGLPAIPLARVRNELGITASIGEQYVRTVQRVLSFDFGQSWVVGPGFPAPVRPLVVEAAPYTLLVAVGTLCLVTVVAVPVGLVVGHLDGRLGDGLEEFATVGRAVPTFLLAAVGFAVVWSGTATATSKLLAVAVLAAAPALVGSRIRTVARAVRRARRDGHVDAARAKGLSRRTVFWRHLAPVALLAHLRQVADDVAYVAGAVVVVEMVVPVAPNVEKTGLGYLFYQAIVQSDLPLVATLVGLFATGVVAVRLLGDLVLALVDPRVGPRAGRR
ncbi:ABC transporter permease subunit [Haloarchaeobius iranensis]|uniref:Peptide/nickel transport system permease protein n=1 Tax=Haloarchaeobius iranensis TaxID=996166 RepID=A0A1G9S9S4_9EURY|nr:ABC transporter permease subunit [Haloarchaeobius iranensis]SDM32206.1 peptide/nickel transport system permease protein [Haloarchaeobius iranensis]